MKTPLILHWNQIEPLLENLDVNESMKNAFIDYSKGLAEIPPVGELIIDDAPWAFIAQPNFKLAMKDGLGGYVHYANEIPRYHHYFWK